MSADAILIAIVTAIAAVTGPLVAVVLTRRSDDRKAIKERRMDIFRTLMRTRKMPIHFDHVGALNLIEIEFADDEKVITAWKDYLNNLYEQLQPDASNEVSNAFLKKRENLLTKLIYEISQVLKFKVDQLDILEGNYLPKGWGDEDWEHRIQRQSLIEVLNGRRPILIQQYQPQEPMGPYPPAPFPRPKNVDN